MPANKKLSKRNSSGQKNIRRVDIEAPPSKKKKVRLNKKAASNEKGKGTHGYQVHITRSGKAYSRFFSDSHYGGKRKCLEKAIAYRDELQGKLPAPVKNLTGKLKGKQASNTGYRGISKTTYRSAKNPNLVYTCLVAHAAPETGKRVSKRFFYSKGSYKSALSKAREWRSTVLAKRLGIPVSEVKL